MWNKIITDTLLEIQHELTFRIPLPVTEFVYFPHNRTLFPRCPRCNITLEREYMQFCTNCGQLLSWDDCPHSIIQFIF